MITNNENSILRSNFMLKLINFTQRKPLFTVKEDKLKFTAHSAMYMAFDTYIARDLKSFEEGSSYSLFFMFEDPDQSVAYDLQAADRRFVKNWTKEQWITFYNLVVQINKNKKDLEELDKSMSSMGWFSEIRKLAKIKRKELKQTQKSNQDKMKVFLAEIREEGNKRAVFGEI